MRAGEVVGVTVIQRAWTVKKAGRIVGILGKGGRTTPLPLLSNLCHRLRNADLDAQVKLHPNVNFPAHLDQL